MKIKILMYALIATMLTGCQETKKPVETSKPVNLTPFSNLIYSTNSRIYKKVYEENEYKSEDIITYSFRDEIVFKGNEELQTTIIEMGKDPGLNIRTLHAQGVTGKGVNVAIIDQDLFVDHPEFEGKIAKLYDAGINPNHSPSMHGPGVTSLLVGKSLGVAPDAKVYYAMIPQATEDSKYFADALYWIIEENKKLDDKDKIRVVSVSFSPSGKGSNFKVNLEMWDEAVLAAKNEGILVLDCRSDLETGFVMPGYCDPLDKDDISKCKFGFPTNPENDTLIAQPKLVVPCSYRTIAAEHERGKQAYDYNGTGGRSWAIPYTAGVLALGWQVNPNLSADEMVELLITNGTEVNGNNIIDPVKFIEAVKETLN